MIGLWIRCHSSLPVAVGEDFKMPTSVYVFIAIATALWLAGVAACILAFRWSSPLRVPRFSGALALCAGAFLVGYFGFTRLQVTFTKSVNGEGWSISSKWFFLVLILFAAVSLFIVCWRRFRLSRNTEPGDQTHKESAALHPHR